MGIQGRVRGAEVPAQLRRTHEYLLTAHIRQQPPQRGVALAIGASARVSVRKAGVGAARRALVPVLRIHHPCLRQLAHVRGAGDPPTLFTGAEEDGEEQRHQQGDDDEDHQQFHQGERASAHGEEPPFDES